MDERHSGSQFAPNSSTPLFVAQRPDHLPPESLDDTELAASIRSLKRKRRAARRALLATRIASGTATALLAGAVFALLWVGPAQFLERLLGRGTATTTYDAALWWASLTVLAIGGVLLGDQLLRGKLRLARGWHHRIHDLDRRLRDAQTVEDERRGAHR